MRGWRVSVALFNFQFISKPATDNIQQTTDNTQQASGKQSVGAEVISDSETHHHANTPYYLRF